MGCDGGSIPVRSELVKIKKKAKRLDPAIIDRIRWTYCSLSKAPLVAPVVCCKLGYLYNKEAVIRHLLEKNMPSKFSHVRNLKDVFELQLTPNPQYNENEVRNETSETSMVPFICPITSLEANGKHPFSALRTCGCVISDRALKEISTNECLQCHTPFQSQDCLPLNGNEEQLKVLKKTLLQQQQHVKERSRKKEKKKKKEKRKRENDTKTSSSSSSGEENGKNKKKEKETKKPRLTTKSTTTTTLSQNPLLVSDTYRSIFTSSAKEPQTHTFTHYA